MPGSFRSTCKQTELLTGAEVSIDGQKDIQRFFVQKFAEIGSADWPGENIVDILTTRAAGLFI